MRRYALLVVVVLGLLLAACQPAMMPAVSPETESGEVFVIALPRIVLAAGEDGQLGIEGIPLDAILGAVGMSSEGLLPSLPPGTAQSMTAGNIQHIELRQTGLGLAVLANGQPLPHIAWNDEPEAAADLAYVLGAQPEQVTMITKLIPILKRIGISLAIKFPLAEGAAEIPFASDEVATAEPEPPAGEPSAVIAFEIMYDEQGVPSIMGISALDLAELTGNYDMPLAISQDTIARAQEMNLQTLQLTAKADGLYVYLNGASLPSIVWDEKMLTNTVDVIIQLNPQLAPLSDVIKQLVPILTKPYVSILVHFPLAPGAEPLPIKMQLP